MEFQSTLPAWGRPYAHIAGSIVTRVSIHAPRVGSDGFEYCNDEPKGKCFNPRSPRGSDLIPRLLKQFQLVSIHAPRVGSESPGCFGDSWLAFQSTLPAWGATTRPGFRQPPNSAFQSTLPAWGATRERGDAREDTRFQSTLPAWGATIHRGNATLDLVSIHAPRVGGDDGHRHIKRSLSVSIHAPRVGSDGYRGPACRRPHCSFNPRSPAWGATASPLQYRWRFQSTLPAWGATAECATSCHSYT